MGVQAIAIEGQTPVVLDLVRDARSGDFAAFERLYREHVNRIHAICVRMTGDPSRAEDLTQRAFVRAWQNLDGFRGEGSFFHWLRRLAINVVLGDRRSRDRREDRELALDEIAERRRPTLPVATGTKMDLENAIADLPVRAREVFVLHDVEGYGHDEIARLLGVTNGTSKSQLHRARKLLREALLR